MNDSIISRDTIRGKARRAHAAGRSRDDHNMNWHADALLVWQKEWDRCERERTANEQQDRQWAAEELSHALGRNMEAA